MNPQITLTIVAWLLIYPLAVNGVDTDSVPLSSILSPTEASPKFRHDCPFSKNVCLTMSYCEPGLECAMDIECKKKVCVGNPKPQSASAIASVTGTASTLRPIEERRCRERNNAITCVNGYCNTTSNMGCVCDKGWEETKCDQPCNLECVNGDCFVDTHGLFIKPESITTENMKCTCRTGWQSRLCDEVIPDLVDEAEKRTLKVALCLSAVLLVVLATSIVTLIVMWRKRVIVVMKLVYFFKLEEEGDGRIYDAYISMGSSYQGMNFVKDDLCPKLQSCGFKLYLQARDQLPGEVPSDSILKAMEQSRRTILIITPDYLKNEWSRFECITAQIETLKLHQRIIPIILEDISTDRQTMDRTLKHILDSVKCLRVPKLTQDSRNSLEKFWKRLELTMPKKKQKIDSSDSFTNINHVV